MQWMGQGFLVTMAVGLAVVASPVFAETYQSIQQRRPDLFHESTGFRVARHRAPTPENIPEPAKVIEAGKAADLLSNGAIAIDVSGALQSRFDELEGTWLVRGPRESLPGAVWLPEVGRGVLEADMIRYLETNLAALTSGNKDHGIIVFCMADCWMSWNAAQRIAQLGYRSVFWFRDGTNGWTDLDRELAPVLPVPVEIE